jgi:hypothetical protein
MIFVIVGIVSATVADTKNVLSADTTNVFCSSEKKQKRLRIVELLLKNIFTHPNYLQLTDGHH